MGVYGATVLTNPHTCSGDHRFLYAGVNCTTGGGCAGVTYNGVALTLLEEYNGGQILSSWYLVNPDVGTHDIAITINTGPNDFCYAAASYCNVKQTAPEVFVNYVEVAGSQPSVSVGITPITDQAWVVAHIHVGNGSNFTVGAGTTMRTPEQWPVLHPGIREDAIVDCNGPISPPALTTLAMNFSPNQPPFTAGIALAPFEGSASISPSASQSPSASASASGSASGSSSGSASASSSGSSSGSKSESQSLSPSASGSPSASLSPSASPSPSPAQNELDVDLFDMRLPVLNEVFVDFFKIFPPIENELFADFMEIRFITCYTDKYAEMMSGYLDKYEKKNSIYSNKYSVQSSVYKKKYTKFVQKKPC